MITYFNVLKTQHEDGGGRKENQNDLRGFICHLVVSHVGKEWGINYLDLLLKEGEEVGLFAQLASASMDATA